MREMILSLLLLGGSFFVFIAALGITRLPDLFTRMHANAKASSLGIGLLAIAAGLHFSQSWVLLQSVLTILFIFLTAPISAHMIARAGYLLKVHLWEKTVRDELKQRYDFKNKILHGISETNHRGK
jgi:multicomponent Na+:H+ antiporter subunit G